MLAKVENKILGTVLVFFFLCLYGFTILGSSWYMVLKTAFYHTVWINVKLHHNLKIFLIFSLQKMS